MDESEPPSPELVAGREGRTVEGGGKKGESCASRKDGEGIVDGCPFAKKRENRWSVEQEGGGQRGPK